MPPNNILWKLSTVGVHGGGGGNPQILVSSNFNYNDCNLYLNTGFIVLVMMIPASLQCSIFYFSMVYISVGISRTHDRNED